MTLSDTLSQLADLAEIRGDVSEGRSLRQMALAVAALPDDSIEAVKAMPPVAGLDTRARLQLQQLLQRGVTDTLASAIAALPSDLRRLAEAPGVGIDGVVRVHEHLGITTAGELSVALDEGHLSAVPGIDDARLASLKAALEVLRAGRRRIPLGRASLLTSALKADLERQVGDSVFLAPVGSLRRYEPTVGDLELLGVAQHAREAIEAFTRLPSVSAVLYRGVAKATIRIDRTQVTLRVVSPEALGPSLVHHTGSPAHVRRLRALAAERGMRLTDHSLHGTGGRVIACPHEEDVYAALGLAFIAPELRHGDDEIAAAIEGRLPALVTTVHVRGDLHMHTTWSDGRDSVETMVARAREIGYEYIAITDHSQSAASGRKLMPADIGQQRAEIAEVRRRAPGLEVLHGVEVDILRDGSLDFPDEALAAFDVVLASLHDGADHTPTELMARYERAMRHPLVHIITHPANRTPGQHEGYALDWDRLFALAVETDTILEVDGAPGHLDLDGALVRRALRAGVLLSVDSDCHRAEWLARQMRFGIATARRGWATPGQILNTRSWPEVRARLARKRGR